MTKFYFSKHLNTKIKKGGTMLVFKIVWNIKYEIIKSVTKQPSGTNGNICGALLHVHAFNAEKKRTPTTWFRCSPCLVSSIYSTIGKSPFSVWSRDEEIRASPPWHHTEAEYFHLLMPCFQSSFGQVASSTLMPLNMEALLQILLEYVHFTLFCHIISRHKKSDNGRQ